jgi:RND family efflux transporter MFP subunit
VVTERNAHPGSLVSPTAAAPLVRIEQLARLRLTVAVPEVEVGGIAPGSRVKFTVPAFPGETFEGLIQRLSHSLDQKTRTMPVELDVNNAAGRLAPGMFAEVSWPVRRAKPSLFVPPSTIVTTTERVFVIRVRDGKAEWVNVRRGAPSGELVEVFGELRAGDPVIRRASDELRPGTAVTVRRSLD